MPRNPTYLRRREERLRAEELRRQRLQAERLVQQVVDQQFLAMRQALGTDACAFPEPLPLVRH